MESVVLGVDFSGAVQADKRIWVCRAMCGVDSVEITGCSSLREQVGRRMNRGDALAVLREVITRSGDAWIGLDFPFGLPAALVEELDWREFLQAYERNYGTPEAMRDRCRARARGRELRRGADVESRTPFSPYNLRLYKQTHYGIREILLPLVRGSVVRVLPMDEPVDSIPTLLETCPASTLKQEGLYAPYKGHGQIRACARVRILRALEKKFRVAWGSEESREIVLADSEGDGLDSVVAALAVSRARRCYPRSSAGWGSPHSSEGRVFI